MRLLRLSTFLLLLGALVVTLSLSAMPSAPAQAQTTLPAPANIAVDVGNARFTVTWDTVTGAVAYAVTVTPTGGSALRHVILGGGSNVTTIATSVNQTITNGTTYSIVMQACSGWAGGNIFNCGTQSTATQVTPGATEKLTAYKHARITFAYNHFTADSFSGAAGSQHDVTISGGWSDPDGSSGDISWTHYSAFACAWVLISTTDTAKSIKNDSTKPAECQHIRTGSTINKMTLTQTMLDNGGVVILLAGSGSSDAEFQGVIANAVFVAPPVSWGSEGRMRVDVDDPWDPVTINEGESITYYIALNQPPTARLTITPRAHNAHDGLLTIHNGVTWEAFESPIILIDGIPIFQHLNSHGFTGEEYWLDSKPVKLTAVDDNVCKSPPERRFWIRHHGSGGGPDWGGWDLQNRHHGLVIRIQIIDDDCTYLAPSPGSVSLEEGASATYTVRLKMPLEDAAYISPRISAAGDSDLDAITVSPERVRVEAGDTSPQTFTVSAGRDADSRDAVLHVDHSVDSPGIPADYLGARVTVVVKDDQNAAREQERDPPTVTGLALTAGSGAVALSPAFSTNVLSYRAEVPAGTTSVTLAPHWSGGASVHAGSRQGGTTFTRPARVRPSGTAVDLALAPDGGATELYVMASGSGGMTTYSIHVTEARPEPKTITVPDDGTPEQQQQAADPVETPGPVVNLQLLAKGKKVIVTWEAPASGGAVDNYIVHLKPDGGGDGKTHRPRAGKTTTTFRNLEPGASYRVWVRAQNEAGKGERVHAR